MGWDGMGRMGRIGRMYLILNMYCGFDINVYIDIGGDFGDWWLVVGG